MKQASNIILAITILIISLNIFDFPWELRFVDVKKNYFFVMVMVTLLPLSVLLWSLFRDVKSSKVVGVIFSVCLAVPCCIVFIFANSGYDEIKSTGIDFSFEEINRLQVNDNNYVLYRTNGGATTSFGLVLRLEKGIGFGLNIVNVVYSKYKALDSTLELTDNHQIKMQIKPYNNHSKMHVVLLDI